MDENLDWKLSAGWQTVNVELLQLCVVRTAFNPRGAEVSSHLPLAVGGGGVYRPVPCLTSDLIRVARNARRP